MRYVVYGIGAVGGTIAARLHASGQEVIGIARGDHLDAVRAKGLTLVDPDKETVAGISAVGSPADIEWRRNDVVILSMKTQDTTAAVRELGSEAPSSITVVCAQNGVENERIALRLFADVQAMCVMLPATHLEPGLVVVNSAPISGILDIGSYPLGTNAATDAIAADLRAADFSCVAHPKVMRAKYAKLVMNLTNALEAACGTFARDSKVAVAAREEATACFEAAGIEHASEEEDRERRGSTLELRRVSGHRRQGGSTWQSLARGTGSIEVDYLNGEVVLLGRLHGVATPVNAALQSIANDLAAAGAPPGSMTIEQVEELAFAD